MTRVYHGYIGHTNYEVQVSDDEFTVVRLLWPVGARQVGSPIPMDRPLDEYNHNDYLQMVVRAIEEEKE